MDSQPVTTSRRLVSNTFFNVGTRIAAAAIAFFMVPFYVRTLGTETYGIWVLIGSVFAYRGMLTMGFSSAVNRYIPVCQARNDEEGMRRVLATSTLFFSAIGLVLAGLTLVVYQHLGSWFTIAEHHVRAAQILLLVVGFCFAVALPLQLFSAVLSGLQRYDLMNLAVLVPSITRVVLLVALLSRGYGLITMGLVSGACELCTRLTQWAWAARLLPGASFSLKGADFSLFKEMMAYGINTLLYAFGALLINKASHIVIGVFLTTEAVA